MDITAARKLSQTVLVQEEPAPLSKLSCHKLWRSSTEEMGPVPSVWPCGLGDLPSFSYKTALFSNSHCVWETQSDSKCFHVHDTFAQLWPHAGM